MEGDENAARSPDTPYGVRGKSGNENVILFRASAEVLARLRARAPTPRQIGLTAREDLVRYFHMLDQALPQFPLEEATLLFEALRRRKVDARYIRSVWADIRDTLLRHRVADPEIVAPLVDYLYDLNPIQMLAIVDAVERAVVQVRKGHLVADALHDVGLVVGSRKQWSWVSRGQASCGVSCQGTR